MLSNFAIVISPYLKNPEITIQMNWACSNIFSTTLNEILNPPGSVVRFCRGRPCRGSSDGCRGWRGPEPNRPIGPKEAPRHRPSARRRVPFPPGAAAASAFPASAPVPWTPSGSGTAPGGGLGPADGGEGRLQLAAGGSQPVEPGMIKWHWYHQG